MYVSSSLLMLQKEVTICCNAKSDKRALHTLEHQVHDMRSIMPSLECMSVAELHNSLKL